MAKLPQDFLFLSVFMATKQAINDIWYKFKAQSKHTHIIRRRNAKENENGPRKKKFVTSLQTCIIIKREKLIKHTKRNLLPCQYLIVNLLNIGSIDECN